MMLAHLVDLAAQEVEGIDDLFESVARRVHRQFPGVTLRAGLSAPSPRLPAPGFPLLSLTRLGRYLPCPVVIIMQ